MKTALLKSVSLLVVLLAGLVGCRTTPEPVDMSDDMAKGMSETEMTATELVVTIEVLSGSPTPLAPVAWAVHDGANPFVESGMGRRAGLEALAEDGDPSEIGAALDMIDRVHAHGVAAVPKGSSSAGPATPGAAYSFTISAKQGDHLSFATMYVQSNDLFYSPGADGLALYDMSRPLDGEVTDRVMLYDAGTEVNEAPGRGPSQAPRQAGPDTGRAEDRPVRPVGDVADGYTYPDTSSVIRVTIHPAGMM